MKSMKRGLISLLAIIMALFPLADDRAYGSESGSDVSPLPITDVYASLSDENLPEYAIDGDLTTRWSAFGEGQWITFDLGSIRTVGYLGMLSHRNESWSTC